MTALLLRLTANLPARSFSDGDIVFLERYYVGTLFGWVIYIHRFVASDPDRGLHDHPWRWAFSIVLKGWYFEATRAGRRKVRWFNWLTGDTFHRVLLPASFYGLQVPAEPDHPCRPIRTGPAQECWTLFVHGPKVKPWGFLRPRAQSGGKQLQLYVEHEDRDASADSAAWAREPDVLKGHQVRALREAAR